MWFLALCLAMSLGWTGAAPPILSRIIGGKDCEKNFQPWHSFVYNFTGNRCGGILCTHSGCSWLPTASTSGYYQLWLVHHNLFDHEDTASYLRILSLPKNHTRLPEEDYSHDLVLLRLAEPAQITDEPQVGSTCYASGWGQTLQPGAQTFGFTYIGNFQCADLKLLPKDVCAKACSQKMTDQMLCAEPLETISDSCLGNSGSPLICDGMLQGVTSWGHIPCGSPSMPAVYTKLTPLPAVDQRHYVSEQLNASDLPLLSQ
ncbi:unnamed protein product [Nyctereutes procyonoides]|uniref:(raccoon dog) hypothetical protein n=1 Tax=Nyctereutes procyonoides TaxID=34880 RepID=A0A811ZTU8_NYCPR|nr:unnamed protein product [Nyctereutes procyonoides]